MANKGLIISVRAKIRCHSERPSCAACLRRQVECKYESCAERQTPTAIQTSTGLSIEGALENATTPIVLVPEQDFSETSLLNAENTAQPPAQTQLAFSDSHAALYDVGADLDPGEYGSWSTTLSSDLDFMNSYSDLRWIFDDTIFGEPPVDYGAIDFLGTASPADPSASAIGKAPQPKNAGTALQDRLTTLVAPTSLDTSSSKGGWPILWQPEAGRRHFVLPPLGDQGSAPRVRQKFFALRPVTDATRTAMADALRLPFEHVISKTVNLENWPDSSKLDYCIDQYFAHFHPVGCRPPRWTPA